MIYKKEAFNSCHFNPMIGEAMFTAYPKLTEIIDLDWLDEHLDSILRYMIMVYDPKSPLVFNERDLTYRKGIAIELAKFNDETIIEAVLNSTHKYSPELIIKYLTRFARSKEWAAICAFESSYWESIKEVIEPISGKNSREKLDSVQKKAVIKQESIEDIKRLDMLYRTFFGEDEELMNKNKRRLTPEMIANGRQ
jgi:hypothetical protein